MLFLWNLIAWVYPFNLKKNFKKLKKSTKFKILKLTLKLEFYKLTLNHKIISFTNTENKKSKKHPPKKQALKGSKPILEVGST